MFAKENKNGAYQKEDRDVYKYGFEGRSVMLFFLLIEHKKKSLIR